MKSEKRRVLLTSGPTRAYIDSIRYIANTSSGALGARIAEALVKSNIPVLHIYGIGSEKLSINDKLLYESVQVTTVSDLVKTIGITAERGDIRAVVHAMAVLDYVPEKTLEEKKQSGDDFWDIRLVKTPKVIKIIRDKMPDAYTVGFKLEVGITDKELFRRAKALKERHALDLVIANRLEHVGSEFHEAFFIGEGTKILATATTKKDIAQKLTDLIAVRLLSE
ncbi:MAG: hypothetical protein JXB48_02970 [Candidatus Latescibacteria bacterium]|nr:hypothetical protein [Candidatus Latescibacterota bacterium]